MVKILDHIDEVVLERKIPDMGMLNIPIGIIRIQNQVF